MPASGRNAVIGFGRQTAEGAALAVPKFETPMGGGYVGPQRTVDTLPFTSDTQDNIGHFVSQMGGTLDASVPVLPKSIVTLFQGVLGARLTTAGPPEEHVITPNDVLPFLTLFYSQPGGNFIKLTDALIAALQLNFSAGQPLTADLSGMGRTVERLAAKWGAAGVVEEVTPFFTMLGANLKLDVAASPAATRMRSIPGGNISIDRNIEAIQTDDIGWQYMVPQNRDIGVTLDDVVFENNDIINSIFFGGPAGTELSRATQYGSIDFTFGLSDETDTADVKLEVKLDRVLFTLDQLPPADPGGAAVRYTLTGSASKPSAGPSIEVTVLNDETGTNY